MGVNSSFHISYRRLNLHNYFTKSLDYRGAFSEQEALLKPGSGEKLQQSLHSFMPGYQVFLVQATNMASLTSRKRCFGDRKEATRNLK